MELTGTNRPKAYIIVIFVLCVCVHCTVLRQQAILCGGNPREGVVVWFCGGDSLGETPSILFEPGELSPVVLMVLHLGGCGRVDGCRNKNFV